MITTIHKAFIVNAMPNSKHMRDLMSYNPPRTIFDQIVIDFIVFISKKSLIIPSKWEYASSLSNTCQSEYKIPLVSGIKIRYTNSYQAKGIWRKWFFKYT